MLLLNIGIVHFYLVFLEGERGRVYEQLTLKLAQPAEPGCSEGD